MPRASAASLRDAFLSSSDGGHRDLHSFPTRRSSDLGGYGLQDLLILLAHGGAGAGGLQGVMGDGGGLHVGIGDRKSTRLNSSHVESSYAGFCLKKKMPEGANA